MRGLAELMRAVAESVPDDDKDALADDAGVLPEARAHDLRERLRLLHEPRTFKVGDLVTQIPALKMYKYGRDNNAVIVTELLPEPVIRDNGGEKRDHETMVIGTIAKGYFIEFSVDGRRYRHWPAE